MKLRLLMASMCVASLALPMSAHRDRTIVRLEKEWCVDQAKFFYYKSGSSYMWYISNQKLDGMAESGTVPGKATTITYGGVEYPAYECIDSEYTTGKPFTLNIRHGLDKNVNVSKYGEAGHEMLRYPSVDTEVAVKIVVISSSELKKEMSFTMRRSNFASKKAAIVTWNFGEIPTDGSLIDRYSGHFDTWSCSKATFDPNSAHYLFKGQAYENVNITISNFVPGDKVAVVSVVMGQDIREKENDSSFHAPVLSLENEAIRTIYSHDGGQFLEKRSLGKGVTIVQAEDFDEPTADRPRTHSDTQSNSDQYLDGYGYPGRHRDFDSTCDHIRIDPVSGTPGGFCSWDKNGAKCNAAGTGKDFGLVNFAQQNWDAEYTGPLEADGTATLDNLADFYGAWTEYTVEATEDMYADISLRTGLHTINYNAYKGGSAKSPNVTGDNVNYMKKYGGAYRIFVDGEPVRANWSIRPPESIADINDWTKWLDNTDPQMENVRARAEENTNSHFVYAIPDIRHSFGNDDMGTVWNSTYKYEIGSDLQASGNLVGTSDDADASVAKAIMSTPDYANIPLSKGKHIIKVQAMGGQSTFDEMMVAAHKEPTTTGIEMPSVVVAADEADAPVEYYNLAGVRVANPANGIFIRKQGSKVTKVVIK